MKKILIIILLSITYFFPSCGNDAKKPGKEIIASVNKLKPVGEKKFKISPLENSGLKNIGSDSNTYKKKNFTLITETTGTTKIDNLHTNTVSNQVDINESNKSFITSVNLKKILSNSEIGETFTQQDLTQNFEIPNEAVKIVKSITKTAEDEIEIKWKSKWFFEKISDAKFTDAKMKIKFEANKMYLSGKAIAIKHNKKLYTDLIIIGNSAYIPSVKGYHWKIGK